MVRTLSLQLQPRAETQAACYKGGAVYIFGGYTTKDLGGYRYYDDDVRIAYRKEGELRLRWTGIKPFNPSSSAAASASGGGGGRAATASTVSLHPSGRAGRCLDSFTSQPSTAPTELQLISHLIFPFNHY